MSAPAIDELFAVMAHASCGHRGARIELGKDVDPEDPMTRLAIALNVLLEDLEYRHDQAQAHLTALLDERTQRLRETQEVVRSREEFISITAHELSTPLTSLQLALSGLRSGLIGSTPDQLRRAAELADRQARKLVVLVDTLLDIGQSEAPGATTLHLEKVDLVKLVGEIRELFAPDLQRRRIPFEIHAKGPVVGYWDRRAMERVITNLLGNAIKFGAGKPIEVTVVAHDATARCVITDHGIGIAPDRLPRIFERFERAVSADHYGGLGLGLFIVQKIVHEHGGTVQAESALGKGATFTIQLPCTSPAASALRRPPEGAPP